VIKNFEKYFSLLPFIILFFIYNFTVAPSVVQIDSGELAAVQYTLGIAHPTGYPLFTILGYLFLHLPLFASKIFQANFLALVYTSVSTIFLSKFLYDILSQHKGKIIGNVFVRIFTVIISVLVLGLSTTFWFQSNSVEVYSLHLLLISISLFLLVKAFLRNENKYWYLFAYLFGLSLSNHMTSILIIPSAIFLFLRKFGFKKEVLIFGIKLSIITILSAGIVYLFLPIRALQTPELNWGNPINFENFWRHFTGAQYQVWIFSSFESSKKQLTYFIKNIPNEFYYPSLLIVITGIISLFKKNRIIFTFTILLLLAAIFYSINYDIVDIDSYFLLAYISLTIFFAFGLLSISEFIKSNKHQNVFLILIFLLLPLSQLLSNFKNVDQTDNFIFEDYSKANISTLPQNSILFSYQWDYLISPSYYFQFVENLRRDITVIDKELLRRSWYYEQLKNHDKNIFDGLEHEVNSFLNALEPFERGGNFNPQILEKYFRLILTKLISENKDRSFFVGSEFLSNELQTGELTLPEGYFLVPYTLTFLVTNNKNYIEAPLPDFEFRIPDNLNKYSEFITNNVCNMLQYRGLYELQFGKTERAKIYSERIKEISPNFLINKNLLEIIN
jgi:hypothetical protein